MKITQVFLYDEPTVPQLRIGELAEFIEKETGIRTVLRGSFFRHFDTRRETFHKLASCRVFETHVPFQKHSPSEEETTMEERGAAGSIVLYDGFEIQNILRDCIPDAELLSDQFHLIFTSRLTCSYDNGDFRYHGRAIICSNPSIISTTGIIEAPAKPRDYYLKLHEKFAMGLNIDMVKNEFEGRFLEYGDDRLGIVVRGYALQAIFYYLTGNPFCESRDCILYNAHWQEDLLHAQIESGRLCNQHRSIIQKR